jgi:hypothetical protein
MDGFQTCENSGLFADFARPRELKENRDLVRPGLSIQPSIGQVFALNASECCPE